MATTKAQWDALSRAEQKRRIEAMTEGRRLAAIVRKRNETRKRNLAKKHRSDGQKHRYNGLSTMNEIKTLSDVLKQVDGQPKALVYIVF